MTAMQEVYDKLNSANVTIKELFNWLADNETRLIAKEHEQIVEARLSVTGLNHASPTDDNSIEEAEQYYSSKYEQK